MSRAQDPARGFFQLGNPFRLLSPKGSNLSPKLLSLLNTFESTLAERIRKLVPEKDDTLSFSWMKLAAETLCETHNDINSLITELELPLSDWEDKWIDVYLDVSVKLLDLCNAFSSELTHLGQGHLLLQCVLHHLKSNSSERFMKARSCLDSWRQNVSSKNPRIGSCRSILGSLVESLNLPKAKSSARGKVLMRALYGVKVVTVYICSVFAAAFSGSEKDLLDFHISDELLWAQAFTGMQTSVNGKIRSMFSSSGLPVLKELEAVDASRKELYPMIEGSTNNLESESLKKVTSELSTRAEALSLGLDLLSNKVDCFFKIVLSGRNALLSSIRSNGASPNEVPGKKSKVAAR